MSLFLFPLSGFSFVETEIPPEQLKALMEKWKPLIVSQDAVPWEKFAETGEEEECTIDAEGYDYCIIKPIYTPEIAKLDGKETILMGYMFPLEPTDNQSRFLIGPYPLHCPFHYHIGPSQIVEIIAKDPIKFSYEPIALKGIFSTDYDAEMSVFYYLKDAELID